MEEPVVHQLERDTNKEQSEYDEHRWRQVPWCLGLRLAVPGEDKGEVLTVIKAVVDDIAEPRVTLGKVEKVVDIDRRCDRVENDLGEFIAARLASVQYEHK